MNRELAIGVDVGGSHVSCAAINLNTKEYLKETFAESDLDNHAAADVIIGIWGDTIEKTIGLAGIENISGIGFAMPGPFDYPKGISQFQGENGKYENTYGLNVPQELQKYLKLPADMKVRFINDATAFAIGEDRFGMAKDHNGSLSITLGTGFGSAFIRDNLPILEGDDVPKQGCVWHLPFENGIADDYFSTRGFLKRYFEQTGVQVSGVRELAELADKEKAAKELFDDFGTKIGVFLKPWLISAKADALIIGGNISNAYTLYSAELEKSLLGENIEVRISELKETASMIGSAFLIDDTFYKKLLPLLSKM